MPSSAERGASSDPIASPLRATARAAPPSRMQALFLALALALGLALAAAAQAPEASAPPEWDAAAARAQALAEDPGASTAELELSRDRLLRLRSVAIELEATAAARLAEVDARMQALGPSPAEGAQEPVELAQRRAQVASELSLAQVPVLEAQEFQRTAEGLIRRIDHIVRARFTADLRSLGPSPLHPENWVATIEALAENLRAVRSEYAAMMADPVRRAAVLHRLPLGLLLAAVGIAVTFSLRGRLVAWIEGALRRAPSPRAIALLINLRNVIGLIVPAVGAGLLFAAVDPSVLAAPAGARLFLLPGFALALIGAGWLGGILFAPRLPDYRLLPVNDAEATAGLRLTLGLGLVLALHLLMRGRLWGWRLTPVEAATLAFPLTLVGGVLLWRVARLLRIIGRRLAGDGAPAGEPGGGLGAGGLKFVERAVLLAAVVAPSLAAIGYLAAANFLLYASILTLGLLGAGVVAFDLLVKTLGAAGDRADAPAQEVAGDGLAPVLVAAVLGIAALPLLALIWGARATDVSGVWFAMRDGVSFGGMRISIGMVATFAAVFALIYGLSRILQSALRNTVLPRTRLDAGGRNAVLAGVGYVGVLIAAVAAVATTGINLTNLAVVAGALSVGIGFGLQNVVSNFVSGVILLVERPIKEGDWIEVGGHAGYVRGISVRSTEIETFERASVILPNSDLVSAPVLNRTHTGMSGRLTVPVGVAYGSDPRRVERLLAAIAEAHPMVLLEPAPRVLFMGLGPLALNFEIRCWLRDVNASLSARSDMYFEIVERFKAEDVVIPFQGVVAPRADDAT